MGMFGLKYLKTSEVELTPKSDGDHDEPWSSSASPDLLSVYCPDH